MISRSSQCVAYSYRNVKLTDIETRVSVQLSELSRRRRGYSGPAVDHQRSPLFVPEKISVSCRTRELDYEVFVVLKKKKNLVDTRRLTSRRGKETFQQRYLTARTRCHRSSSSLVKLYRRTASPEPRL